ncbi:BTAD domain-containing putative transcriptional regulator [Nonomuraea sp. NPDC047897]|uniref:AfsR/SARP family transcriptional regulator n=1 Tax=Nonomuraea sp. NPDC047897 TaxID=3364346 RepID=UPI00371BE740
MRLEIRCLGPWEVEVDGVPVAVAGRRRIGLLARLALTGGQAVPTDRLVADVWAHGSAATASKQLHIVVSKLRETLGPGLIETLPGGRYRLAVEQVDAREFTRLAERARAARAEGAAAAADGLFRRALGLWRGAPLTEVDAPWARLEADRLERERLAVLEDHAELRLAAGDERAVAAELAAHVGAHPHRERPAAQLMLALYRDGRAAEALEVYQRFRRAMVEELGIEPGAELRRLHQAVLVKDPALDLPPSRQLATGISAPPAELPADVRSFTARAAEIEQLRAELTDGAAVTVISGPGGIGKSALAVHVAHALARRFSDGVLYVNLRGSTTGQAPLAPIEALRHLLRSLGLDGTAVPANLDEAAARYRSLTAASDLMVLLDNARDVRQVRPLIPAGRRCRVVITSRDLLATLDNARHLHLGGLDDATATTLLTRIVGPGRVDAEPDAARELVRQCGGFPLALRITGARLAARLDWSLSDLAVRLADATRRLDLLEYADLAVRASIAVSHRQLGEEPAGHDAARLLPLLGLLDLAEHTPTTTAALAGWSEHRAEIALDQLLGAHLLEPAGPGRFQLHDLVGLYAREQDVPCAEATGAVSRVLHHYAATSRRVSELLLGGGSGVTMEDFHPEQPGEPIDTVEAANGWLDRERDNLLAAVRQAARTADSAMVSLTYALQWLYDLRGWFAEVVEVSAEPLRLAKETEDWQGAAFLLQGLGSVYQQAGHFEQSVSLLQESLACWDKAGQPERKAGTFNDLGITYALIGRHDDALDALENALDLVQRAGRRAPEASVRNNLVHVHYRRGSCEEAVAEARRALQMRRELDDTSGLGIAHDTLADALRAHGLLQEAVPEFRRGIELQLETGHTMGGAVSRWWLGHTLHDLGRHEEARREWRESLELLREARLLAPVEVAGYLAQPVPDTPGPIKHQL